MSIKLTKQSFEIMEIAYQNARSCNFDYVRSQDILLAMFKVQDSGASYILGKHGIVFSKMKSLIEVAIMIDKKSFSSKEEMYYFGKMREREKIPNNLPLKMINESEATEVVEGFENYKVSDPVSLALEYSKELAFQSKLSGEIESYWILCGLVQEDSNAFALLNKYIYTYEIDIFQMNIRKLFSPNNFPTFHYRHDGYYAEEEAQKNRLNNKIWNKLDNPNYSLLEDFTNDLTKLAKDELLKPVIGRKKELRQIEIDLSRRDKNNVVLIGEGGVGKSAIIEGLANSIASNDIPSLKNRRILQFNLKELFSTVSGNYDRAILRLIEEMKKEKDVILFIDEIHMLGLVKNLTDTLKPVMARSDFRIIGATTPGEWFQYLENDSALVRRFEKVLIDEPSIEDAIKIITNIIPVYENFHGIRYSIEAIEGAVKLSKRYLSHERLPDSAITVLDNAAALLNLDKENSQLTKYYDVTKDLKGKLERAQSIDFNDDEIERLKQEIKAYQLDYERCHNSLITVNSDKLPIVTLDYVKSVLQSKTNIPMNQFEEINEDEKEKNIAERKKLSNLKKFLSEKIIGQDQATELIADSIIRAKAGFHKGDRPIGVFLFAGTTGTGKTVTAKVLSEELFGNKDKLIRFDMSEYQQQHEVAKLIGAPPGYVGYGKGGLLTNAVKRNPYSVVLFDEIEKAHPNVFDLFLQIFDDGRLTDSLGFTTDFSNTIIIMTTNLGASQINQKKTIGFNRTQLSELEYDHIDEQIKESSQVFFRPEFLNRLDEIVTFKPLKKGDMRKIAKIELHHVANFVKENGYHLIFDNEVIHFLVDLFFDPKNGARPIRRGIEKTVFNSISSLVIKEMIKKGDTLKMQIVDNQLEITRIDL